MRFSRYRFLVLGATGLMTLGGLQLTGCGKGAPPDSPFRGSYRSIYTIPSLGEAGTFSFSVEQKGHMTGSLVDNNTNKAYSFDGGIASSGFFDGNVMDGANRFRLTGTLSIAASSLGGLEGGDFRQTRNGVDHPGSFSLTTEGVTTAPSNTFRGAYSGSYNVPGSGLAGVTSFSVNTQGDITGSLTRGDETGSFTGKVQESGSFTGTVRFAQDTVALSGTLNKTTDGSTSGNFLFGQGAQAQPGTFGPTQTTASGDSPYQGAYRGTYGIPERGENGNISFTVDPRGALTGFMSQTNNSPVGTFTGAFKNDGTFSGNVSFEADTGIATRPIVGKVGTSAVNDRLAGDFVLTINGVNKPGNFEVAIGAAEPDSMFVGSYTGPSISNAVFLTQNTGTILDDLQVAGDADSINPATGALTGVVTVLSMSVDKEGSIVGTWGGYSFTGRVTNDGRIIGTWAGFPLSGIISRQLVRDLDDFTITPAKRNEQGVITEEATVDYTYVSLPGFAGNVEVTIGGQKFNAVVAGIGGSSAAAE